MAPDDVVAVAALIDELKVSERVIIIIIIIISFFVFKVVFPIVFSRCPLCPTFRAERRERNVDDATKTTRRRK